MGGYHAAMRTIVLVLILALLPLRMWAADGMAVRMAQEQAASAEMPAAHAMPEDCPMMAQAGAEQGLHHEPSSEAQCVTCYLCAAAASLPSLGLAHGAAPAAPPGSRLVRFASTDLAPDLRPPIA